MIPRSLCGISRRPPSRFLHRHLSLYRPIGPPLYPTTPARFPFSPPFSVIGSTSWNRNPHNSCIVRTSTSRQHFATKLKLFPVRNLSLRDASGAVHYPLIIRMSKYRKVRVIFVKLSVIFSFLYMFVMYPKFLKYAKIQYDFRCNKTCLQEIVKKK